MSYNIERKYGCCVQEDTQRHVQFTRSKMKKTTLLKNMLLSKEILVMPGAYDCISAKLIEKAGFRAAQCTGYGIAASRIGKPDVGILSVDVMLDATRNICHAVDIPVMADGDTGFGNVVNVWDTVIRFEEAGAAGINLEDQVFPKRCGHMNGKQVISSEEMVEKIKAARYAANDPDFVINARTDSIAVYGVEEAIRRGNAYAKAGATLIFVEAPPEEDTIKRAIKEIKAPVSINMAEGGKTPMVSFKKLEEWGAARVSTPITPLFAAYQGTLKALNIMKKEGIAPSAHHPEMLCSFEEFTDTIGLSEIEKIRDMFTEK